jgi:hypothetical protein
MAAWKDKARSGIGPPGAVVCAACVGVGAALPAYADVQFVPRVGVAAVYTDNYLLVGPDQRKLGEFIGLATPGFRFVQTSARLQSFADYSLELLHSQRGGTRVFHDASIGAKAIAIERWLNVQFQGLRGQYTIDPTDPRNIDNLFLVTDTINVTTASVTPELLHYFKTLRLDVKYAVGIVNYSGPQVPGNVFLGNSKSQDGTFSLASIDQNGPLAWGTLYRHERVDYAEAERFEYDLANIDLSVRMTRVLRLILRAGAESDPRKQRQTGGLAEPLWQGGFLYRRSAATDFQFLVGHRYFGRSYDAFWHHTARFVALDVEYHEDPTTEVQQLVLRGQSQTAETGPPGIDQTYGRFTPDTYLLKRLVGNATITGRLTTLRLSLGSLKRDYVTSIGRDDVRTATIVATRRFGPLITAELRGEYDKVNLRDGSHFDDRLASLRLSRRIGLNTSVYLSANHLNRTGSTRDIYAVNWFILGIDMSLGKIRNAQQGPAQQSQPQ